MIEAVLLALAAQLTASEELDVVRPYRECAIQAAYYMAQSDYPVSDAAKMAVTLCADRRAVAISLLAHPLGEGAAAQTMVRWDRTIADDIEGPILRLRTCQQDAACNAFFDQRRIARLGPFTPE